MAARDSSVRASSSVYPLDDFVWTVRNNPKTGKPYLCVSTPGHAPSGAVLYVPKPKPIVSPKSTPIVSPKLTPLSSPTNSGFFPSSTPTSSASASTSIKITPVNSPAKKGPSPPPRDEGDEPPPPDDDDDEDIMYCEVCQDDERHPASHRCMLCELEMCRKKSTLHANGPTHRLVTLAEIKEQEIAKYRALFLSPGFDMKKKYVEVLFDDPGSVEDGEIPLTKGEFIEVDNEKNETPEWWHGVKVANRAVSGLFPFNYTTTLNLQKLKLQVQPPAPVRASASMRVAKPKPLPSSCASASMSVAKSKPSSPLAISPSTFSPSPLSPLSSSSSSTSLTTEKKDGAESSEKCNFVVVATHDFKQTTNATYLVFTKGERITITRKKSDKWWWGVNGQGKKGWVPTNHVQVVSEAL